MTQTTADTDDIERAWITTLAEYWLQTDWDQFSGQQKSRADSFGERVEVATRAGDVHGALRRLARGLGLAAPELPTEQLDALTDDEDAAMRVLRRESIYLVNKADETVQNYFAAMDDADADASPTTSTLSDYITE